MSSNGSIIVPFLGGTVKFLEASTFTARDGRLVALADRIEIYVDRKEPAKMSREQLNAVLDVIDRREDVRQWLDVESH